jgi:hypothetical protein
MEEPPADQEIIDIPVVRPAGTPPAIAQDAPAWLLTTGLAVLATAVAVLLLISVPAGI